MEQKRRRQDLKLRKVYKSSELIYKVLKIIYFYKNSNNLQLLIHKKIDKLRDLKAVFKLSIKNYCIFSGRSRSVYKSLKTSRISLRELGSHGLFFGLKKHS